MPAYRSSVELTEEQRRDFGTKPLIAKHDMHDLPIFRDDQLTDLLDRYPRKLLQAYTMGTDPLLYKEWNPVDVRDVSGAQIFEAVQRGRLFLNIMFTNGVDERLNMVMKGLYESLSAQCPRFKPYGCNATLLVSSPNAQVYYHVDGAPNFLFHIRGAKTVYVYPAGDPRFLEQEVLEDIYMAQAEEDMPFSLEWDRDAMIADLKAGDAVMWPHNAPHRVVNGNTVNVSLSTNHWTEEGERRKLIYRSNRFFRRRLGLPTRSTEEVGLVPRLKTRVYGLVTKLGLDPVNYQPTKSTKWRLDPNAPLGRRQLDREVVPWV